MFLCDVVSSLPVDLYIYLSEEHEYARGIKFMRLLRVSRVLQCLKMSNVNLVLDRVTKFTVNPAIGRTVRYFIIFLFIAHICACVWWACGDPNNATSWAFEYRNDTATQQYIASLYWAIGTMSGVGYGDIFPGNTEERVFTIFVELIGVITFGVVVGYVSTLVESMSYKNFVHKERYVKVTQYVKARKLPPDLVKRMQNWIVWSIRSQSVFDEKEILHEFPVSLQQDVMLHSNKKLISIFPILRGKPSGFLLHVTSSMRPNLFLKEDVICHEGELGKEMYFLEVGHAYAWIVHPTMASESNDVSADVAKCIIAFAYKGQYFGESELLDARNDFRHLNWQALSQCIIHTMGKEAVRRIKKLYPEEFDKLLRESVLREELYASAFESMLDLDSTLETTKVVIGHKLYGSAQLPRKIAEVYEMYFTKIHPDIQVQRRSRFGLGRLRGDMQSRMRNQTMMRAGKGAGGAANTADGNLEVGFEDTPFHFDAFVFGSNVDLPEDKCRRLCGLFKIPISPTNSYRVAWDALLGIVIAYNVTRIPFRLAFDTSVSLDNSVTSIILFTMELSFDLLFIADLCLNFITAYKDENDVTITDLREIAKKYLKTWFTVDCIASIPVDMILVIAESSQGQQYESMRLIKTLRVARALKLFRGRKLLAIVREFEQRYGGVSAVFTMSKLMLQIIFIAHLLGCFWYMISSDNDRWDEVFVNENYVPGTLDDRKHNYVSALYWSYTTMTTVGYGDIVPHNEDGQLYAMFSMLLGTLIFSYVIGNFSSIARSLNRTSFEFQKKMDKLNEYMNERGLPHRIRLLCRRYLVDLHSNMISTDEEQLLDELPHALASDILLYVHSSALDNMRLFSGLDKSITTHILSMMNQQIFLPFQYLIVEGQTGYGVIFIVSGTIQTYKIIGDGVEVPLHVVGASSFIAECYDKQDVQQHTTAKSITYSTTFRLSKESTAIIQEMYPSVSKKLQQIFSFDSTLEGVKSSEF